MFFRVSSLIAAGLWTLVVSAQTAPSWKFPGVPQFTVLPKAPPNRQETQRALRDLLTKYSQGRGALCSIPLLQVLPAGNVEKMPVMRPPEDKVDNMPSVKLPAPPCEEAKR